MSHLQPNLEKIIKRQRAAVLVEEARIVRERKEGRGSQLFDFTLGTHPISTKGTTQFSGAKRRSDLDCLQ